MIKLTMVLVMCGMLAGFSQSAFADGIDDCNAECSREESACVAKANEYVNDIEVQDAKAICQSTVTGCNEFCMTREQNKEFMKPPVAETADSSKDAK